jgi:hypothetical protein
MTLYYIDQGSGLWNDPDNWFQNEAGTIPNYTVPSVIDDCVINAGSTVDELFGIYASVINFGTVTENFDAITENRGIIITNNGIVELNTFDGIITTNNGNVYNNCGTIITNNGFAGPCLTLSYTDPNMLKADIHASYENQFGIWKYYHLNATGLFAANSGTNQSDYRDHLIREFNRKISILNQPTELFISPFDDGFRFTGVSIQ